MTRGAIRHFAWGVGDNNPLWLSRLRRGLGVGLHSGAAVHSLRGRQHHHRAQATGRAIGLRRNRVDLVRADPPERHVPGRGEVAAAGEKAGRGFPYWVLQTGEVCYCNQHERLVATAIAHCARTPRGDKLVEARDGKEATAQ